MKPGDSRAGGGDDGDLAARIDEMLDGLVALPADTPWPVDRATQLRALRGGHAFCTRGPGDVLRLAGADRLDLLQRLSATDLRRARPGDVVATVFANDKGRLVDVAMTAVADDALWLLAGQGAGARLAAWLERFVIMEDVQVERRPALAADTWITGHPGPPAPGSWQVVGDGHMALREPAPWGGLMHTIGGAMEPYPLGPVARSSPWHGHILVEAAAYDQWCVEVGRLRPGPDLDEALNPLEAGLTTWVSLDKGCFIGQEVIARLANYDKVRRRPVRLQIAGATPAKGTVLTLAGRTVGFVVTATARLEGPGALALAVVLRELRPGAEVELQGGARAEIEACFGD